MDQRNELAKFRAILFFGAFFLMAGFMSCTELRYSISGVEAEARVTDIERAVTRRRSNLIEVQYRFSDRGGKSHDGGVNLPLDDAKELALQRKFPVVYLPSNPRYYSTPVQCRSMVWPVIFLAMTAGLGASIAVLVKKAKA